MEFQTDRGLAAPVGAACCSVSNHNSVPSDSLKKSNKACNTVCIGAKKTIYHYYRYLTMTTFKWGCYYLYHSLSSRICLFCVSN
jgi:hypothetical protein